MRVQIAKWGNSTAVRLPKAVVDELGLQPGVEAELTVEGAEVRLRLVRAARKRLRIEDLVSEMDRLGRGNAPPAEDWGDDLGAEVLGRQ
jgi:antitoxin MazE